MAIPGLDVSASVRGVKECIASLEAMQARVDAATLKAMKAGQQAAKTSVRSGMRGRPRWDHRGAIGGSKSIPAVSLHLSPHHVVKGGGPGLLTGTLRSAVGVMKRPRRTGPATYQGGIGVGGSHSITQIYRQEVEAEHAYMVPGVKKAEPKIGAAYQAAWAKATEV